MIAYCAFLRAVNVGGRTVRMGELVQRLAALGLADVRTVIASGNVLFTARGEDAEPLARLIEADLLEGFGFPVVTILRRLDALEALVASNPFKGVAREPDAKLYVTFLRHMPKAPPAVPLAWDEEGVRLVRAGPGEAFSTARRVNGRGGIPNLLVEKAVGVPATTRNWNTVLRILHAASNARA